MKSSIAPFVLLLILLPPSCKPEPSIEELTQIITQLNQGMEAAYNSGDTKKVAAFYDDEASLIGPRGYKQQGREAIDAYWTRFKNPIRWQLDVIKVANTAEELYQSDYWKNLKNKPPDWNEFNVLFKPEDDLLYQLGHSKLEYEREDATHHVSDVDFIIVWKKNEQGFYRIYVDSYAKN